MNFVDEAKIFVKAGDGGAGVVSFRRERYVPRGGPDGGDGGDGGSLILKVDSGLNTLAAFRRKRQFSASKGEAGRGKNQHGKNGTNLIILVPPGTLVKDPDTGWILADLVDPGQTWIAAKGGQGGRGNARFVSSTRQTPCYAQPGTPGEERWLLLELKLLADVGLIGTPNSGKSTLLSRISAARPKIADYPFTTLTPYLGVVELSDERTLVVADIPGLIEGAHAGVGMGLEFLRHVERTKILLYVVDASLGPEAAARDFETVTEEVRRYHAPLLEKPQAVALNKIDVASEDDVLKLEEIVKRQGLPVFRISALAGTGLSPLLESLYHMIQVDPNRDSADDDDNRA